MSGYLRHRRDPGPREIALAAEKHAHALSRAIGTSAYDEPRRWLEVADALEVAEDAWREAGDEARALNAATEIHNIFVTLRYAQRPLRRDPQELRLEQQRRRPSRGQFHSWIFDERRGRQGRWVYENASSDETDLRDELRQRLAYEYQHLPPDQRLRFGTITTTRRPPSELPSAPAGGFAELLPLVRKARSSARARAVLHDALLERYPEYAALVKEAERATFPTSHLYRPGAIRFVFVHPGLTLRAERAGRRELVAEGSFSFGNTDESRWKGSIVTFAIPSRPTAWSRDVTRNRRRPAEAIDRVRS